MYFLFIQGKLEQAVTQANNFHADLNTFIAWLTETEKILNSMSPVSRIIPNVTEQIKDQKVGMLFMLQFIFSSLFVRFTVKAKGFLNQFSCFII